MQPVLTHVPPKRPRSMMATRWPEAAIRTARYGPDCPVPMTITSKLFFMIGVHPQSALEGRSRCHLAAASSKSTRFWVRRLLRAVRILHVRELRIERQQMAHHSVCPAKAILQRVFAAAAAANVHDIVFLYQFAGRTINAFDARHEATGNDRGQVLFTVATQAGDCDPLQWRPAVRRVPLLVPGGDRCRDQTTWPQQLSAHRRSDPVRLCGSGEAHE